MFENDILMNGNRIVNVDTTFDCRSIRKTFLLTVFMCKTYSLIYKTLNENSHQHDKQR